MADRPLCDYSIQGGGKDNDMAKIVLTAEDDGRVLKAGLGEAIRVELEVQGGTGYNWYIDGLDESILKPAGEETEDASPEGVVGGLVLKAWTFEAVASGDAELKMLYYRVWEGREKAVGKFSVTVHVHNGKN